MHNALNLRDVKSFFCGLELITEFSWENLQSCCMKVEKTNCAGYESEKPFEKQETILNF